MRSALIAVLLAAAIAPASAAAQSAPFAPLPPAPQEQPETVAGSPNDDGEGISGVQQALLIAAGILFVLGITFLIARDARRNAPVDPRPGRAYEAAGSDGAAQRKKLDARAVQKQKAAAKRARQARKKNRPVRK